MALLTRRGKLAFIVVCQALLLQIQTLPLQAENILSDQKNEHNGQDLSLPEKSGGKEGIATYYSMKYAGKRTASGSRYSPRKMTAAHPTLPMGTKVKVVHLGNSNEVIVTVNDRCRKRRYPTIDLSHAAAKELGFLGKGTARVSMQTLDGES